MGLNRLDTGIVDSSPAQGMAACPRLSVLCRRVQVEALRQADPPPKET